MGGLAAFGLAHAEPLGPDSSPAWGLGGWSLERFGAGVTILRSTAPVPPRGDRSGLILSCAASDHRLTLALPLDASVRAVEAHSARVLFRPLGPDAPATSFVVAQGQLTAAHALVVSATGAPTASPVVAFVRLLLARPTGIDVLLHTGTGPIGLRQLTAVRLPVSSRSGDEAAFRDVIRACTDARGARDQP